MSPTTQARIDRLASRVADYLTPGQLAAFREIAEHELRCQDRDTRHACAETVLTMQPSYTEAGQDLLTLCRQTAHDACMNARSV